MSKLSSYVPLLLLMSAILVCNGFGQTSKAAKIDDFLSSFVKNKQFSGEVLASENGKIIYEKAFGTANADFNIPNQTNTRIGIASITKLMTLVILNRLIEEKKIAPEDKLGKYIPDFPNGERITIEMLARHRSGIPHRVMPPEQETVPYTSAEFIERVKQAKLLFEPGTQNLYSSAGYAVLARTLEIASGKPYAQLLQEYVFAPAGMTDSLDFNSEAIMERRAQDYYLSPEGFINAPLKDYSFLLGAGSVFSTARDVYRFGEAILDGKYGETNKALIRNNMVSASGSTNGHRSYLEIESGKKYGYVLLSNLGAGSFEVISQGITDILQGKEVGVKAAVIPKIVPNPNKNISEFLGRYVRTGGGEAEIVLKNGFLYSSDIKLFPTAPDCFFEYKFFGNVCFIRDAAGKIKEIKWASPGAESVWVRQ
ncbi:MAG TPA: serine hydrolase [Pyrinomonadaceae bacterium]|jgi:CubicO group peptidase (beta-lactamase class C family)